MGVFTKLSREEIKKILALHSNEALLDFRGIPQGIQNTIYRLETAQNQYILTLYEQSPTKEDILKTNDFVAFLSDKKLKTAPLLSLSEHNGKFVSLSPLLQGESKSMAHLSKQDYFIAGKTLAQLHQVSLLYTGHTKANPVNIEALYQKLIRDKNNADRLQAFSSALTVFQQKEAIQSPQAMIHGDFFPDNILWSEGDITGVLDFNFCYMDFIFYDLAIALTAWSFDESNVFNKERFSSFLEGYCTAFDKAKIMIHLYDFLLLACLRFFMTRLDDLQNRTLMQEGQPHNPRIYEERYLFFKEHGKSILT